MFFFIDESWQTNPEGLKVGVLAAVQIKCHDYNTGSQSVYQLKVKNMGFDNGNCEIKGKGIFRDYVFDLENRGIVSRELTLARDIFSHMKSIGACCFASVVFASKEIELACANVNQLERPFFYLFERIDLFMKENHPGLMAKLIFDDRGVQINQRISKSVSNFFHKSHTGQTFDNIVKIPFFAISNESVGIQMADMIAYILGAHYTKNNKKNEFFRLAKDMQFVSRTLFEIKERKLPLCGVKVIKEKEAGELFDSVESKSSIERLENPSPASSG